MYLKGNSHRPKKTRHDMQSSVYITEFTTTVKTNGLKNKLEKSSKLADKTTWRQ